jgi:hypothetical protein
MGNKAKDYKDWSAVLYLMDRKEHLSPEGLIKTKKSKQV